MILWRLILALTLLLGAVTPARAGDVFSTDSATPKRATVNGTAFFPRIAYDSGASSNFADQSVAALNLGQYRFTHYLNYQYGPLSTVLPQLTPLVPLGMWGFATGNSVTQFPMPVPPPNQNFAVIDNPSVSGTPFRALFDTQAGAGGAYITDEPQAQASGFGVFENVLVWRNVFQAEMPHQPRLYVLFPEGPLVPETSAGSGVESQFGSAGFMEHVQSVANPYWWNRNLPAGGNDWIGDDIYVNFHNETDTVNGVGAQGGFPHFLVADRAAFSVAAATASQKVPVLTLQLFGPFQQGRFPTPNEMWQHTTMAIAEGIRGLAWWQIGTNLGLRDQTEPTKTNANTALINITTFIQQNEATILSTPITGRLTNSTSTGNALNWRKGILPAVANGSRQTSFGSGGRGLYQAELNALNAGVTQWSPMLDQSGDVRHRVFRVGSSLNYLVFAYNYAPTAHNSVTFTFDAPVSSVTVVDEARTITPVGATWTDNFGGSSSLTLGGSRNAHIYQVALASPPSTNCFTWGFEANTGAGGPKGPGGNTVQFNGFYGNSTITTAQAHSGTHALQVPFKTVGDFGILSNDSAGVDLEQIVVPAGHPCEIASVGGPGLYARAWIKIAAGFNWNGSVHSTSKVIRWFNAMTMFLGSGGLYVAECDGQQPASGGGVCKNASGIQNSIDGCSGNPSDGSICAKLPSPGLNAYSDGLWHEHIVFLKPNSSPGTSTNPGANPTQFDAVVKYWIDGVQVASYTGWHLHDTNNAPWGLGQQFGVFWYNQVGPSNPGPIWVDDVSIDTAFNSSFSGGDVTPPTAPTGLTATALSPTWVDLAWTAGTDANGVAHNNVLRCAGTCTPSSTLNTTALTSYSDLTVSAGTTYSYCIQAVDPSNNTSACSSTVTVTTPAVIGCPTHPEPFCPGGSAPNANVLWCDDFEDNAPLASKYADVTTINLTNVAGVGFCGSRALKGVLPAGGGAVVQGHLKLPIGKVPAAFTTKAGNPATTYREIYWREYFYQIFTQAPSATNGDFKLSRAASFGPSSGDAGCGGTPGCAFAEAAIAHLWNGSTSNLEIDPANGAGTVTGTCPNCTVNNTTDTNIRTNQYNDFANLSFLGRLEGCAPSGCTTAPANLFAPANAGRWFCVEGHARANTPGAAPDGVQEFWIDGVLQASRTNLNFFSGYTTYSWNMLLLDWFSNTSFTSPQTMYRDNLVVSTQRIGCIGASGGAPAAPTGFRFGP